MYHFFTERRYIGYRSPSHGPYATENAPHPPSLLLLGTAADSDAGLEAPGRCCASLRRSTWRARGAHRVRLKGDAVELLHPAPPPSTRRTAVPHRGRGPEESTTGAAPSSSAHRQNRFAVPQRGPRAPTGPHRTPQKPCKGLVEGLSRTPRKHLEKWAENLPKHSGRS